MLKYPVSLRSNQVPNNHSSSWKYQNQFVNSSDYNLRSNNTPCLSTSTSPTFLWMFALLSKVIVSHQSFLIWTNVFAISALSCDGWLSEKRHSTRSHGTILFSSDTKTNEVDFSFSVFILNKKSSIDSLKNCPLSNLGSNKRMASDEIQSIFISCKVSFLHLFFQTSYLHNGCP